MEALPPLADRRFPGRFAAVCLIVAAVALGAAAVVFLFRVVLLVVLALVLAELLRSMADGLASWLPGPRTLWLVVSVVALLAAACGLVALFVLPIVDQAGELLRALVAMEERLRAFTGRLLGGSTEGAASVRATVGLGLPGVAANGLPLLVGGLESGFDGASVLFLATFLAAAPGAHRSGFLSLWPASLRARAALFVDDSSRALRAWLVAMAIGMPIVGLACTIGLSAIGVRYWLVFGIFSAFMELVPYAGPFLGFVGPFATCLVLGEPGKALGVAILYLVVQGLMNNAIQPYLVKRQTDIPASLALAAIVGLGAASGALGVLVAVPSLAIALSAARAFGRRP